jgi:hypothetical protein
MKQVKLIPSLAIIMTIASVFMLQSCTKIGNALQYNLALQSGSVTVAIPPMTNTGSIASVDAGSNTINIDSFIKAHTAGLLGVANIQSVKLTSCTITVQNGNSANNFANFESCSAAFSSNAESTPYSVNIADNPDAYATSLTMPVDTAIELKNYLVGNQFNYSVGGKLRRSTTDTLNCTIQFQFNIRVQG